MPTWFRAEVRGIGPPAGIRVPTPTSSPDPDVVPSEQRAAGAHARRSSSTTARAPPPTARFRCRRSSPAPARQRGERDRNARRVQRLQRHRVDAFDNAHVVAEHERRRSRGVSYRRHDRRRSERRGRAGHAFGDVTRRRGSRPWPPPVTTCGWPGKTSPGRRRRTAPTSCCVTASTTARRGARRRSSRTDGHAQHPDVAVAADGHPVVAWSDNAGGAFDVMVRELGVDGAPVNVSAAARPS